MARALAGLPRQLAEERMQLQLARDSGWSQRELKERLAGRGPPLAYVPEQLPPEQSMQEMAQGPHVRARQPAPTGQIAAPYPL
jgi:hypothetical protein